MRVFGVTLAILGLVGACHPRASSSGRARESSGSAAPAGTARFCGFYPLDMGGPLPCGHRKPETAGAPCMGPYADEDDPAGVKALLCDRPESLPGDGLASCAALLKVPVADVCKRLAAYREKDGLHGQCDVHPCGTRRCELHMKPPNRREVLATFEAASYGVSSAVTCREAGVE